MSECLNPTSAWRCGTVLSKDFVVSPRLVFSATKALEYFLRLSSGCLAVAKSFMDQNEQSVPCGHCRLCQLRKRKEMSVRLSHEASCHESCCFITLTYNDDNVPTTDFRPIDDPDKKFDVGLGSFPELTLIPSHVQKFIKRLRRHLEYVPKIKSDRRDHVSRIRYFAVGEYGSKTHRPHYHVIIFGWRPSDGQLFKMHNGNPVYRSSQIEKLWKYGFSSFSDVNPYVAKYCARYVTKKFARLEDPNDLHDVVPEFTLQSVRDGGIGALWFDKFGEHACSLGLCTLRCGERISKCSIPRYYWSRLRKRNLPLWIKCRDARITWVKTHPRLASTFDELQRKANVSILEDSYFAQKETF